ncbi:MAG: hypothetical protein ACFBSC_11385 [Microcoleaceae cyanobacterium]
MSAYFTFTPTAEILQLRDWRPRGEVIAPLSIRNQMRQKALEELGNY